MALITNSTSISRLTLISRGIEGPCSTVQLANIRRGLQDHLYLTMARELGLRELRSLDAKAAARVEQKWNEK